MLISLVFKVISFVVQYLWGLFYILIAFYSTEGGKFVYHNWGYFIVHSHIPLVPYFLNWGRIYFLA